MQRTITAALAAALVGCAALIGPAAAASAQGLTTPTTTAEPSPRVRPVRARTRIDVTLSRPLYRQCVDWLAVEHRPSGDTIVPQTRCWWTGAGR
jgi:hypothetical protein